MSTKTGIEWTDATWNPIRGCSRVSEGCRNCYAETVANRFCGPGQPYEGVVQIGADGKGNGKWNGQIKFVQKHLLDPLKWKPIRIHDERCGKTVLGKQAACTCRDKFRARPRRIFVNSMSDLFHENVTDEMLDKIFAVMALCPQHTFQVLTKRPARMAAYLAGSKVLAQVREAQIGHAMMLLHLQRGGDPVLEWSGMPLPNVQLGVSVENQAEADERIPLLLQTPAAVRFISAEPLLGAIDLTKVMDRSRKRAMQRNIVESREANPAHEYLVQTMGPDYPYERLDWVIVGGESGPGARPMHPHWARSLRDQCVAAGVPFFFKQWGEHAPRCAGINDSAGWDGMKMQRVGKKAAGRLLDGREWNEMPEVAV